ncbi:MAG: GNAT family N-acetyltransferase [Solirubrobacterales bacterium]|nr:GNAT family N-acetyltransferase [Solirubrobacterales bacterium]
MGANAEEHELRIDRVDVVDLPVLMPLLRGYCDFYEVEPRDDRLVALCRALIDDPTEGEQALARTPDGEPLGFATVFWTWQTLYAARVGVLNDLYVVPEARGRGVGRRLIEHCRGLCRKRAAAKLVWETALDNETAQRLYDGIGAEKSTWLTYEIDAW